MMTEEIKLVEKPTRVLAMNPKKFILWLFMVSIVMLFASLTSAYIVRRAEGNWVQFDMPSMFWITSAILIASSITMHLAYVSAKKDKLLATKALLGITLVLGVSFLIGQWYSWVELIGIDIYFVGNPSGSFIYVLTGVHGFHIVSALIFLIIVAGLALRLKIHSKSLLWIELCTTYWHFLDVLWLYLFGFLLYYQ